MTKKTVMSALPLSPTVASIQQRHSGQQGCSWGRGAVRPALAAEWAAKYVLGNKLFSALGKF